MLTLLTNEASWTLKLPNTTRLFKFVDFFDLKAVVFELIR